MSQYAHFGRFVAVPVSAGDGSEGVRMPFRTFRGIKNVHGVYSLKSYLGLTYEELGEMVSDFIGRERAYSKSAIGTWALADKNGIESRKWFKKYWMQRDTERAFKSLIRDYVSWVSGGRYRARVTGTRVWHVQLRRVS